MARNCDSDKILAETVVSIKFCAAFCQILPLSCLSLCQGFQIKPGYTIQMGGLFTFFLISLSERLFYISVICHHMWLYVHSYQQWQKYCSSVQNSNQVGNWKVAFLHITVIKWTELCLSKTANLNFCWM
jgi:hypothetical protein